MNLFKQFMISVQFIGLMDTLRVIQASLLRDWYERRFQGEQVPQGSTLPGKLLKAEPTAKGGKFHYQNARLEVIFITEDMVRLSWQPGKSLPPDLFPGDSWPDVSCSFQEIDRGEHTLSSSKLTLLIDEQGSIRFQDEDGILYRQEHPPRQRGTAWQHTFDISGQEKVYGLGERAAPLNLRRAQTNCETITYELWNEDPGGHYTTGDDPLYISIPVFITRKPAGNYILFYENAHRGTFCLPGDPEASGQAAVHFSGGALEYTFGIGPTSHLLSQFTRLTGRSSLPPRWALGYHQCRWGYKTEQEIRQIVKGFKEHDLPLSAVHLDIDYMEGYRVFTINRERFPNLAQLTADLAEEDIQTVTILDPGVKRDEDYFMYKEGKSADLFLNTPAGNPVRARVWPGWCTFPDFSKPETRQWWSDQYPRLLEMGVQGIWHDMNEPSAFVGWGRPTLPDITRYDLNGNGGDHLEGNNLYGLFMNQAGYEGLHKYTPDRRPWLLSRSGWAGTQRYAWNWTADVQSTWQALRQTLATMLGIGLSGIPFTGSDIGGFSGHPTPELFIRWFQLASLTPFFRGHSATGTPRREPWVYGEPYTTIIRKWLRMRYSLIPYLYTLAWEAVQTGAPLMRPLFWEFEDQEELDELDHQYLLGSALMVAPVLEQGQHTRRVLFPPGVWYSFWEEQYYKGPAQVEIPLSLETIPLFIRGGAVLPTSQGSQLTLHIAPPFRTVDPPVRSLLYSDAGEGYGAHRLDHFIVSSSPGKLTLTREQEGDYPFPYQSIRAVTHGDQPTTGAFIDGKEVRIKDRHLTCQDFDHLEWRFDR